MAGNAETMADFAYNAIRSAIVGGRLEPGSQIVVRPWTEQLRLSPTPIKAALTALEREGFIQLVPHRGYFVPAVSPDDMQEIYELREVIDGIAARKAAALPTRGALVRTLTKLLASQSVAVEGGEIARYNDLDLQFHQAIWLASGNSRLGRTAENLVGQMRMGSGGSSRLPGRLPLALAEHRAIVEAIVDGDPAAAERLARDHVHTSWKALEAVLGSLVAPATPSAPSAAGDREAPTV